MAPEHFISGLGSVVWFTRMQRRFVKDDAETAVNCQPTCDILNSWLQRDLSLYGRGLLSKAEGLSHFVYPSLSLFVENKVAKEINIFLKFVWKNKAHKLKKEVLSNSRADGGIDFLDFSDNKYFFK